MNSAALHTKENSRSGSEARYKLIPQAFITVVVGGGAEIISGLLASVLSLVAIKTIFMNQVNILLGHVAMLVLAFVIIRMMPSGISDWIEKRQTKMKGR